ncbi:MAG: hypothetical protein AUH72_18475 [Acidobacteria bacterium 13_1_40CM_4_65_8]|nr:MAG: hypothetical protein AUH72_18475 [Acidobacteria bacterium 13_1_40CM_4_65_8]
MKVTVTSVWFQPFALGAGAIAVVMVGGVVSLAEVKISIVSEVPGLPRSSTAISLTPFRSATLRSMRGTTSSSLSLSSSP